MTALELIDAVIRAGGTLKLIPPDTVRCRLPNEAIHLADAVKECKQEVLALLRQSGGRIATFPHCPRCCSNALYRENNIGTYECLTCGLSGIEESIARRQV